MPEGKPVRVRIIFEDGSEEEYEAFAGAFGNPSQKMKVLYRLPTARGWEGFHFLSQVARNLESLALEIRAKGEELVPRYAG